MLKITESFVVVCDQPIIRKLWKFSRNMFIATSFCDVGHRDAGIESGWSYYCRVSGEGVRWHGIQKSKITS